MNLQKIYSDVSKKMEELFGDKLKKIFLYGSYAKNTQHEDSDIDFLVLVDESEETLQKHKYQIADVMAELTLNHDVLVSITESSFKHYQKYTDILPFYKNVEKEGIEIYGQTRS